jgi:hypothetical protein
VNFLPLLPCDRLEQIGFELLGPPARAMPGKYSLAAAAPISSPEFCSAAMTSAVSVASTISRPGTSTSSIPFHRSEMIGVPHAAASNSRTEGDQPAATMSARVTFSVKREAE